MLDLGMETDNSIEIRDLGDQKEEAFKKGEEDMGKDPVEVFRSI